jgi:hypothetical protein
MSGEDTRQRKRINTGYSCGIISRRTMYIIFKYISQVPFSYAWIKMNIIEFLLYKFKAKTFFDIK